MSTVEVGFELPEYKVVFKRSDLVQYAGASGDFNIIHWNERTAISVGLPGVIAHGMLTMALAGKYISDWAGGPQNVKEFSARFTKPVIVPAGKSVDLTVSATVLEVTTTGVRLEISATSQGVKVLGMAKAFVVQGV